MLQLIETQYTELVMIRDTIYIISDGCERFNPCFKTSFRICSPVAGEISFKADSQARDKNTFKVETVSVVLQSRVLRSNPCRMRMKVEIVKIVT